MTESKMITLSKLKSLSGADILAATAKGSLSVEINGVHAFDIVAPLNALDDKFLSISRYVAGEVSTELARKLDTLKVEDMFNPKNAEEVVRAVADAVVVGPQIVPEPAPVAAPAKPKPRVKPKTVAGKPGTKAKPAPKKPAAKPAVKPEAAPVAAVVPAEVISEDETLPVEDAIVSDVSAQTPVADEDFDALFGEDAVVADVIVEEPSAEPVAIAKPISEDELDALFDEEETDENLKYDPFPENTKEDRDEAPDEHFFVGLDADLALPSEAFPELDGSDDEEEDLFGDDDDTPLVRQLAAKQA